MQARKSFIGLVCLCAFSEGALAQQSGALDITFNPGSGANHGVVSVALATNGDVVIGGGFTLVNGQSRNNVALLNPDGSLDSGFVPGQGVYGDVNSVAIDPSGHIYIGGDFVCTTASRETLWPGSETMGASTSVGRTSPLV